jgi:hypothetical protein
MKRKCTSAVAALLASSGLALGQASSPAPSTQPVPAEVPIFAPYNLGARTAYWPVQQASASVPAEPLPAPTPAAPVNGPGCAPGSDCGTTDYWNACDWQTGARLWFSTEYLVWCIRDSQLPVIVGTAPGSLADVDELPPGAINPIFGGPAGDLDYDEHSGFRLTLGYWFDEGQSWGWDLGYFQLERKSLGFSASSPGDPLLGPVFFDPSQSRTVIIEAASPGLLTGRVDVRATERLWGIDTNVRCKTWRVFTDRTELLVGFRHIQFDEGLASSTTATIPPSLPGVGGTTFNIFDAFGVRNRFFGPQVGVSTDWYWDRWYVNFLGKLAFGDLRKELGIQGFSTITQPGLPPDVRLGGALALPTNIGHYTTDQFTVVPELTISVGCQLNSHTRAFIGYTFLFIADVIRVGDQIDAVEGRQVPLLSTFDPAFQATRPRPTFEETDFWAHGLNLGLEFRY